MELVMVVITMTCILFSALLTPCSSLQIQIQSSFKQANYEPQPSLSLSTLPRKLRITEEVTGVGKTVKTDSTFNNKHKANVSGNKPHLNKEQEMVVHGSRGTWQREWAEGTDALNFVTKDYAGVKRRRPIHNKSVPVIRP